MSKSCFFPPILRKTPLFFPFLTFDNLGRCTRRKVNHLINSRCRIIYEKWYLTLRYHLLTKQFWKSRATLTSPLRMSRVKSASWRRQCHPSRLVAQAKKTMSGDNWSMAIIVCLPACQGGECKCAFSMGQNSSPLLWQTSFIVNF